MKKNISKKNGISILIGLLMGILLLNFFLPKKGSEIRLEEFALGENNKKSMASVGNINIHCNDLKDLNLCIEGHKVDKNNSPVILWLGNSQLHAINQYQPGNETAAPQIFRILKEYNFHTLTLSQANANLQEHYLLFAYLLDRLPIKTLILPIVFDDMRENKIRKDIKSVLKDQASFKRINLTLSGKSLISRFKYNNLDENKSNFLKDTKQTEFEDLLDEQLGNIWPLWNKREILRGELFGKLYLLRNSIFGIKATTTRKMIRGNYFKNIHAYQDILKLASDNKVKVLVYIPPIRNDIKIPYNFKEYNNFKNEIKNIAEEYKVYFTSLEDLIPSEFWGRKASTNLKKDEEVDFMHFQVEGHRLLAEAIFLEISNIWQLSKKP
tara:strand:- start:1524 stop:2669 length:1146 start_codon:yes stop_codon:yes gene_type:complete